MNRKALILTGLCLVCAASFAEDGKAAKKDYNLVAPAPNAVTGVVKSAVPADLARPESSLIVTDGSGKDIAFALKANAVVYTASDGRLLSMKELAQGERVQVNYDNVKGTDYATAVKVLSPQESQSAPVENTKPVLKAEIVK